MHAMATCIRLLSASTFITDERHGTNQLFLMLVLCGFGIWTTTDQKTRNKNRVVTSFRQIDTPHRQIKIRTARKE